MNEATSRSVRAEVLRVTLPARRLTTVGKVEQPGEGEVQFEPEGELLRLEQDLYDDSERWRARQDSNLWPSAPEADALSS